MRHFQEGRLQFKLESSEDTTMKNLAQASLEAAKDLATSTFGKLALVAFALGAPAFYLMSLAAAQLQN